MWLQVNLTACKILDDISSYGRLFHVFDAASGKARSAVIPSQVVQTLPRSKMNAVIVVQGFEQQAVECSLF